MNKNIFRLQKLSGVGRKNQWPVVPDVVLRLKLMWELALGNRNVSVTAEAGETAPPPRTHRAFSRSSHALTAISASSAFS